MRERDDVDLAHAFEEIISLEARLRHEEAEQLRAALVTNRRIGMALGVLMGVRHLDEDQAWDALVKASRDSNRKVRDLAEVVIRDGTLP